MTDDPGAQDLLDLARAVARDAAALVRDRAGDGVEVAATKTSVVDIVTDTDRATEALIRERLLAARPGDAFHGEESGAAVGTSRVRWVVDPIDGTVNFLYGLPHYAVSIAAEVDREVVAGVVVNAATGTEYAARRGGGATRDGRVLRVRPTPPLQERLVLTGFWYDAELRAVQGAAVARLLPHVRDIRRLGSCALDLCHVAEGAADGYVEEGVQPWDHAAGGLVASEAGARLELTTGAGGRDLLLCAPADGFDDLRVAVAAAGFLA